MFKKNFYTLYFRQGVELCLWFIFLNLLFIIPLILGQFLRLRSVFWPFNPQILEPLLGLTQSGALILLEVSIPLAFLFAVIITVRRLISRGLYWAWSTVGGSSKTLLLPILTLSLPCVIALDYCAHNLTPKKIVQARIQSESLLQNQWRSVVPNLIRNQLFFANKDNHDPERFMQSTWLFKSETKQDLSKLSDSTVPSLRFYLFSCDHVDHSCLSAWWSNNDELESSMILNDLEIFHEQKHLHVKKLKFQRPPLQLDRIYKTFGPPNSLPTDELKRGNVHHQFIAQKRSALSLSPIPFALLGAYLGLQFIFPLVLIGAGILIGINFGLLRGLELFARAGYISPVFAAWAPILLLLLMSLIIWFRLNKLSPRSLY